MLLAKILGVVNKLTFTNPADSGLTFIIKKGFQKVRNLVVKYWDPTIEVNIKGNPLLMPLSHRFPNFISEWPLYDSVLPRLCQFIFSELGYLRLIDVGANIGETIGLVSEKVKGDYLCIEPSTKYFSLLKKNTHRNDNIVVDNHMIGELKEKTFGEIMNTGGTASFKHQGNNIFEIISLDELVYQTYTTFINSNIIKIDTDGFDYKIIRGAKKILYENKPILFFELAPEELIKIGGENPYSIFSLLHELSYEFFLVYDNHGFLIAPFQVSEINAIKGIIDYAQNKWSTWLDVIAFHKDCQFSFNKFYDIEKSTIKELAARIPRKRHF